MQPFEKLGVFYLGRLYDMAQNKPKEDLLLYDSKDLVTHAVCVGMTGSGKTGLCIDLLEEAALDGIPSLCIDPKGDLTNLMLTFPDLSAQDFEPWVNVDDARNKGLSAPDFAKAQAETWSKGLASWGEDGERIRRLKEAAEFAIYTPGSNAGYPISILKSFAAPSQAIIEDNELLSERINTTTTGLLTLLGIQADPVRSREHILISNILNQNWLARQDVDLPGLIQQIQSPPMKRVGVLELDSFYPANQRFELAMQLNNLLAAPGFAIWLEGAPLDVGNLLYTPHGKPRVSIVSIAHLGDAERMFFVSLLLNQVLSWVRTQSGTTSLRAILYMDEIFGYFPPVANPPSKPPLLTLLKQARAFGLGIVLATQNPVDLDYKGLANTGTWLLGRLQTERDKARVLDGLEGVAAVSAGSFDKQKVSQLLAGLGNRVFLMHNVHEDADVVFTTRWAMSYLRGPLTRDQIKMLMAPIKAARPLGQPAAPVGGAGAPFAAAPAGAGRGDPAGGFPAAPQTGAGGGARPALPTGVPQFFAPPTRGAGGAYYRPMLYAAGQIYYANSKLGLDETEDVAYLIPLQDGPIALDWDAGKATDLRPGDLDPEPVRQATFGDLPAPASRPQMYDDWRRDFARWLSRNQKLELLRSLRYNTVSKPGELERDFRLRLQQTSREKRDDDTERLRKKYEAKISALNERLRKAEQAEEREQAQANQQKMSTAVSLGATLLSAVLGRKRISTGTLGRATTAARGASRTAKEQEDVRRAGDTVKAIQAQIDDLEAELTAELDAFAAKSDPASEELETVLVRPKASDVSVQTVALAWFPG